MHRFLAAYLCARGSLRPQRPHAHSFAAGPVVGLDVNGGVIKFHVCENPDTIHGPCTDGAQPNVLYDNLAFQKVRCVLPRLLLAAPPTC